MPSSQEPLPTISAAPHILVADDQPDIREALRLLLKAEGYAIATAASPAAVLAAVQGADFDTVLLDLNYARDTTTGREGLELVSELQAQPGSYGWPSADRAGRADRGAGGRDFRCPRGRHTARQPCSAETRILPASGYP